MLDSVLATLQTNLGNLSEWWESLNVTYRAAGCFLVSLLLIWDATRAVEARDRDRKFFVTGLVALGLLAYGAVLFVRSTGRVG
jgi:hypothetical protein